MLEGLNGREGAVGKCCATVEGFGHGCRPTEIRFAGTKNPGLGMTADSGGVRPGSWAKSAVVVGDTSSPRQAVSLWVPLGLSSADKVAGRVAEGISLGWILC